MLVGVFVLAIYAHAAQPAPLRNVIAELGFPSWMGIPLVAAEAGILTCLILYPSLGGLLAGGFLVAASSPFVSRALRGRPQPATCGCFGSLSGRIGASFYARNIALFGLSLTAWRTGPVGIGVAGLMISTLAALVTMFLVARLEHLRPQTPSQP